MIRIITDLVSMFFSVEFDFKVLDLRRRISQHLEEQTVDE
jgi:hypothetical protein